MELNHEFCNTWHSLAKASGTLVTVSLLHSAGVDGPFQQQYQVLGHVSLRLLGNSG